MTDNEYTNELQNTDPQPEGFQQPDIPVDVSPAPIPAGTPAADPSQRAMLAEAMNVVDTLKTDREQLQQYNDTKKQLNKSLDTLKRNIEKEKNETVKNRRLDVETGFDRQIKEVDGEISAITSRRQKAREEGVKNRVAENTAGLRQEIENTKTQIVEYLKENKAPSILGKRIFYTFFSPMNAADWAVNIIIAALMVGAIILAYVKKATLPVFLCTLGAVVALLVIYVVIYSKVKERYHDQVVTCKVLLKGIAEREKAIKAITKNIQKDTDDSVYNLSEYDNELQMKNQQKTEINAQKAEALTQFDNTTAGMITGEIDSKYAADISTLEAEIAQNADSINLFTEKVAASETRLNNEFVQYVGARNLSHERLEKMIGLIDSGEAASVSDAVSKMK